MSRTRRMTLRQRAWLPYQSVRVFGPLPGLDVTALRAALVRLHAQDPADPAVCALDAARARWGVFDRAEFAARVPALAVAVRAASGAAEELAQAMIETRLGTRAAVLGAAGDYVGLAVNHAVGDGRTVMWLLARLLADATGPPRRHHRHRAPLLRAATGFYLRDPRRIAHTLTLPHDRPAPAASSTRPWRPRPTSVSACSPAGLTGRLREYRDATAPE
ncbi:MAG TPA: hypothetical protein VHA75_01685, partial [Rugosimonospora sp.]|nr:hypothetical protein [Rugosimonospora sp.]